jgi:hypothetical protein
VGKRSERRPDVEPAQPAFPSGDVAVVFGKDVNGVHILRRRDENSPVEAGLLQPLVEGRPISGELVTMKRRDDLPFLFDGKSELPGPETATETATETRSSHGGPSQVATESYRKGWDAIWGGRAKAPRRDLN